MNSGTAMLFAFIFLLVCISDKNTERDKLKEENERLMQELDSKYQKIDFIKEHETGKFYQMVTKVGKVEFKEVKESEVTKPIINPKP